MGGLEPCTQVALLCVASRAGGLYTAAAWGGNPRGAGRSRGERPGRGWDRGSRGAPGERGPRGCRRIVTDVRGQRQSRRQEQWEWQEPSLARFPRVSGELPRCGVGVNMS